MTAANRHAYSRLETDEELIARVVAKIGFRLDRPGWSADERAAEVGLQRRIVWVTTQIEERRR